MLTRLQGSGSPQPVQRGFTLIEALVALTIFSIGALMVVPALFSWVQANTVSMQRDAIQRILSQAADTLSENPWDSGAWDPAKTATFGSTYNACTQYQTFSRAVEEGLSAECLSASDWETYKGYSRPDLGLQNIAVDYAVLEVTDRLDNPSRVMKLRMTWQGPAGRTYKEEQFVQRNAP